jgi:hypothetical protein
VLAVRIPLFQETTMTISSVNGNPSLSSEAADALKQTGSVAAAGMKTQLNNPTIEPSLEVSITTQHEPLALLSRTAIANLSEALTPQVIANPLASAGVQDHSPDATAAKIVAVSSALFDGFRKLHPDEEEAVVLQKFMDTMRSGMENGIAEAREILQGLGVLGGDIAANIDKTHALLTKGYADFEAAQKASPQPGATS